MKIQNSRPEPRYGLFVRIINQFKIYKSVENYFYKNNVISVSLFFLGGGGL